MLKIDTWLNGIGLKRDYKECPAWPPDLFALTGALIRRSGTYLELFKDKSPMFVRDIKVIADRWREAIDDISVETVSVEDLQKVRVPEVQEGWRRLVEVAKEATITEVGASRELVETLIRLTLIADQTSAGIGIGINRDRGVEASNFLSIAETVLYANDLRSFCWEVPLDTLCVLGKQHTPSKGATFRSLSHHLALYQPDEVEARWINPFPEGTDLSPRRKVLNLLLLPWPTRVEAQDFEWLSGGQVRDDGSARPGYFRYRPTSRGKTEEFPQRLARAMAAAKRHAGSLDAIVFPELALAKAEYDIAEWMAFEARAILVCGLRQAGAGQKDGDANVSILQAAGAFRGPEEPANLDDPLLSNLRFAQAKHHRWYVDRAQIVNYQLGGYFSGLEGYWEDIALPARRLNFVTLNGMTWTVLVCEDLARQDPAADVMRAVGPNLLIALLMDGPQLTGRWPARYASVLAEDPGTSVLTLTSLGMAERSRPIGGSRQRSPVSRVIALWRDAIEGEIQIALDPGDDACVLTLEIDRRTEYCADGRDDGQQTLYPRYAGHQSFGTGV